MAQRLQNFMCQYIEKKADLFKGYLIAALDNKDQFLSYLDDSLGTDLASLDIRTCELLTDAGLFRKEEKFTRDGRNSYNLFYLTDLGKEMAQQIKDEGFKGKLPEKFQALSPN
jgi:hypothetical protein